MYRKTRRAITRAAAMAIIIVLPAFGQEADIPTYKILGCETACAKWTDPEPIGKHTAAYPMIELQRQPFAQSEAYVLLHFTVAADGTVKDLVIEKLIGAPDFGRHAIESAKEWRYKPATADGVPAERPNWRAEVTYVVHPLITGAGIDAYRAYNKARKLIDAGQYDEANKVLVAAVAAPRLSFYECEMLSLLLAVSYAGQKDFLTAREYIEQATFMDARFLSTEARDAAIRQRITLDALTGQFADALAWHQKLEKKAKLAADDAATKMIERVKTRLADPKLINVPAKIPPAGPLAPWTHTLLRRNFAFFGIEGKLDRFQLDCDQKKIVSPVSISAEWHVPKSWSGCELLVYGEPGTKFVVAETNE